ncbi:hypothetical protein [Shewanella gaetbuli]|uniref:Uncharacterized protein n=1 Tax=Shewanella gaetbuli TaxID=220752 RepID=A0A9X1ZQV1_9GAMM|nr:hypothetical protein [Shewanella gaetbuli]MCL1143902.1 hypothetical protein [Shewanella gaetbuli]
MHFIKRRSIQRVWLSQGVLCNDVPMTVFLSDFEEYEGGELIIAAEFGK